MNTETGTGVMLFNDAIQLRWLSASGREHGNMKIRLFIVVGRIHFGLAGVDGRSHFVWFAQFSPTLLRPKNPLHSPSPSHLSPPKDLLQVEWMAFAFRGLRVFRDFRDLNLTHYSPKFWLQKARTFSFISEKSRSHLLCLTEIFSWERCAIFS